MKAKKRKYTRKPKPPEFRWVGVKFIQYRDDFGDVSYSGKTYTYKVRGGAEVHVGKELVVVNERGTSIVLVVSVDQQPADFLPQDQTRWKWIKLQVAPL